MARVTVAAFVSWWLLLELRLARATRSTFLASPDDVSPAPRLALVATRKNADPNWNQDSLQSTDTFGEDFVRDDNGRKGNGYQAAFDKMEKKARAKFAAEQKKEADEKAKILAKKRAEEAKVEAAKKAAEAKEAAAKKAVADKKAAEERKKAEAERQKAIVAQKQVLEDLEKKAQEAGEIATQKEKEAVEQLDEINKEKKEVDEEHHQVEAAANDVAHSQAALDAKKAEYDALCDKVKQKRKEREEAEAKLANATRDVDAAHNATLARQDDLKDQLAAGVQQVEDAHAAKRRRKEAEEELEAARDKLDVMTGKKEGAHSSAHRTFSATGFLIAVVALPLSLRPCSA